MANTDWERGSFSSPSNSGTDWEQGEFSAAPPGGTMSDLGKSVKVGVQKLPGMLAGLADLPVALATGARPFTKAADAIGEGTGFQPGKWADETKFSQGHEDSRQQVDAAWDQASSSDLTGSAANIAKAYLKNPAYTLNQVAESAPSMVAGGAASKVLMGVGRVAGVAGDAVAGTAARAAVPGTLARTVGEKWAVPVAAGAGEGAVTAGQQMEQYQGENQQLNALASLGAGAGTGLIGVGAGRLANKLGLETAETAMAKIGTNATSEVPLSLKRRVLSGMVSEAVLQELPQSAQEQMWQNFADGKPVMEGVARAATEGALAGGVMGAGANISGGRKPAAEVQPEVGQAADAVPLMLGNTPDPLISFPDGTVGRRGEVDAYVNGLPEDQRVAARASLMGFGSQPAKTPSQAMGIDPKAGPMSAAAAQAVDSGAYMPPQVPAQPLEPEADPVVLQNRDRTSAASIAQMQEIAANPDYLRVGPSRDMTSGAPVVFGELPATALLGRAETVVDGKGERMGTQYAVVDAGDLIASNNADGTTVAEYATGGAGKLRSVAGNGRTAGLQAAYQMGTAGNYRQELADDAQALGMEPQAIAAMQRPVLVRVMQGADVTNDMGDRTNITATQKLSPLEQAGNDARRLDVRTLAFDEGGSPTFDSIKGFVSAMPVSERGDMLNADGTPTRQAVDRLMAATFKQAYDSDELVQLYAQATDPDARAVMAAAADASGVMANLKGAGEFDVRAAVADAAKLAVNATRQGMKLSDVIQNADMDMNPDAFPVAAFMAQNIRTPRKMAEGLRRWGQLALEQARIADENTRQGGMFGAAPTLSRQEIFARLGDGANPTQQGIAPAQTEITTTEGNTDDQAPQAEQVSPQQTQAGAAQAAPVARNVNWRKNAIQAGRVAREKGIDPTGKRLAQIVAEIDAVDQAPAQVAAATPNPRGVLAKMEAQRAHRTDQSAPAQAEVLQLTSYTADELRAQAQAQEQADKAQAKQEAQQAAADKARADKAEVDARMEASADNFRLGQTADDAVSGQSSVFDAPETAEMTSEFAMKTIAASAQPVSVGGKNDQESQILFSRAQTKELRNLVTLHNLTEENLMHAEKMGGIPVPSIGIAKMDSPFSGFGGITLIAPKEMIDPQAGVPVYDRDAWAARYPQMNFKKVKAKAADAFYKRMKQMRDLPVGDGGFIAQMWEQLRNANVQSPDKLVDLFMRYESPRALYAQEVLGKTIKAQMTPYKPSTPVSNDAALRDFYQKNADAVNRVDGIPLDVADAASAEFDRITHEAIDRVAAEAGDRAAVKAKMLREVLFDDSGRLNGSYARAMIKDFPKIGTKVMDDGATREAINKAVKRDDPGYRSWVEALVHPLFDEPTITLRGREVEATLDNIVDAMTVGPTAGVEKSMTFGPGKVAAMLGRQFKSLDEIKAARDQIVSAQAESDGKKVTSALLDEYRTHVSQFYSHKDWRGQVDTWAANDDSMEALAKAGKMASNTIAVRSALSRMGFKSVDARAVELALQAIDALRNASTDYFEAKPQRAVKLNEFKGAVVPRGTSPEAIAVMEKNGIVVEVHGKAEGAREKAIQKLAIRLDKERGDIRFSFAGQNAAKTLTDTASVRNAVATKFPELANSIDRMIARGERGEKGGLVVIESADARDIAQVYASKTDRPLATALRQIQGDNPDVQHSDAGDIQGFYDAKSGLQFIVAPNVTTQTASAVVLHEAVHGQQRADLDAKAQKLLGGQFDKVQPQKTRDFLARVAQRIEDSGEGENIKEIFPYIVEQAVLEGRQAGFSKADGKFLDWVDSTLGKSVGNLVRDLVAAVRSSALKRAFELAPSIDDLVALAKMAVHTAADGTVVTTRPRSAAQAFTRSAGDQVETPAFKAWYGDWQNATNGKPDTTGLIEGVAGQPAGRAANDTGRADAVHGVQRRGDVDSNPPRPVQVGAVSFPGATGPVGEDSRPVRFYHGTRDDVDAFSTDHQNRLDKGWLGRGVYATSSTELADSHAEFVKRSGNAGPNTMPLFMAVRNPYVATNALKIRLKNASQQYIDRFTQDLKAKGHDGVAMAFDDGHIELMAFEPTQVKSAIGNNGNFDPADADISHAGVKNQSANGTRTDRAVMEMAREGKSGTEILAFIAGTSKGRFNKQVAKLLMKANTNPTVTMGAELGEGNGFKFLAKYSRANNEITLTEGAQGQAEQIFLHETIHAATLKALDKKGLASLQMRRLYQHVKRQGGAADNYGMKNVGEFVAEAFTNKEFQQVLRGMSAPSGGSLTNAWDGFVRILRSILGLPQDANNALSQALELGVAVMREDMALRRRMTQKSGPLASEDDAYFGTAKPTAIESSMGTLTPAQASAYERVAGTKKIPTLKERADTMKANLGLKLRQGMVDQFAAIKQLDQNAYMQARMSKASDGALEATLLYGIPFLNDGVPDVKIGTGDGGFAKVLAGLKGEQDRWMMWVAAQRADRLKAEGKENLMTSSDISALKSLNAGQMADGAARMPVYAKALVQLNTYNDAMLKMAMESGLIDQAAYDLMKGQPYVPFYRLMEEDGGMGGPRFSSGLTNQKAWQKLKGGTQQLNADLLQNTLMNWSHLLQASAKNRAALATMDAAEGMAVAYKVQATTNGVATKGAVKVMRDGNTEYWMVEEPYLLEAIGALNYTVSPLMKPLSKMKQILTWGVTVNPTFKIRNLIRDSVSAMAQSDLGYNPAANVGKGWKLTAGDSQIYASMVASGGVIKFGTQENTDRLRAQVAKLGGVVLDKNGAEKLWDQAKTLYDVYAEFGDRTENANRAALYDKLIKKGHNHAEASFMARDLMDFSMGGSFPLVRFLTQTVPFLNARLVGLDKLGRAAIADPRKFGAVVGAVSLASLALLGIYSDDDDWKKREDWDRDSYWWFKIGDTAYRIPKPFEVGAIGTLAERTAELVFSKEMTNKRFMERLGHMLSQTFAFDPVPQAIKPLLDIYSNKDSFTGRASKARQISACARRTATTSAHPRLRAY